MTELVFWVTMSSNKQNNPTCMFRNNTSMIEVAKSISIAEQTAGKPLCEKGQFAEAECFVAAKYAAGGLQNMQLTVT